MFFYFEERDAIRKSSLICSRSQTIEFIYTFCVKSLDSPECNEGNYTYIEDPVITLSATGKKLFSTSTTLE